MESNPDFVAMVRYLLSSNTQQELQAKTGVRQNVISQLNRGLIKPKLSYQYGSAIIKAFDEQTKKDLQSHLKEVKNEG